MIFHSKFNFNISASSVEECDPAPISFNDLSTVTNGEMRTDDSDGSQFLDFMMGEPGSKSTFTFTGSVFDMESFKIDKEATLQSVGKIKSFKVLTDR